DGTLYVTRTGRFWTERRAILGQTVDRLTRDGARVLLVATEPPGRGMLSRCSPQRCAKWDRWQINHYHDATRRWNRMLEAFAQAHPDQATFFSVTMRICQTDQTLCDDRTPDGRFARPDGTHYAGQGKTKVVRLVL